MSHNITLLFVIIFVNLNSVAVAQITPEWIRLPHNGSGSCIITDANGNVITAGMRTETANSFSVVKYNSSGVLSWSSYYNGTGNNCDISKAVVADINNNVFAGGECRQPGTGSNVLIIKYSSEGVMQWVKRFSSSGDHDDVFVTMKTDRDQNLYIAGNAYDSLTNLFTAVLIKYSQDGDILWNKYYSRNDSAATVSDIAIDSSNNVTLACSSNNNIATVKYNSEGNMLWEEVFDLPGSGTEIPTLIGTDDHDNVYIAGESRVYFADYLVFKYSSPGALQWHRWKNISSYSDRIVSMSIDKYSNVTVTGNVSGLYVINTVRYNAYGDEMWSKIYDAGDNSWVSGMRSDVYGNVFMSFTRAYFDQEVLQGITLKYDLTGDSLWSATTGSALVEVINNGIAMSESAENIYLAGQYSVKEMVQKYKQQQSVLSLKTFFSQGFYDADSDVSISDVIRVELRKSTAPYNLLGSSACQTDPSGNTQAQYLNVNDGTFFYIVVKHRNSIETWSSSPVMFSGRILSYDFTDQASKALGNNMIKVSIFPERWADYGGDIDQNGTVNLNDIIKAVNASSFFKSGYIAEDVNGDRAVNLEDISLVYNNSQNFVKAVRY